MRRQHCGRQRSQSERSRSSSPHARSSPRVDCARRYGARARSGLLFLFSHSRRRPPPAGSSTGDFVLNEGPLPFGPFVNRNHFATWVIMAAPLCFGYIIARAARRKPPPLRLSARARGSREWLTAGWSGWHRRHPDDRRAHGIDVEVGHSLAHGRGGRLCRSATAGNKARRAWWTLGVLAVVVGLALARVDVPALAGRFGESGTGVRDRVRIWPDTLPIVRDFWLTGTGWAPIERRCCPTSAPTDAAIQSGAQSLPAGCRGRGDVIGFAVLTALIAALARTIWRRLASDATGATRFGPAPPAACSPSRCRASGKRDWYAGECGAGGRAGRHRFL